LVVIGIAIVVTLAAIAAGALHERQKNHQQAARHHAGPAQNVTADDNSRELILR
jgi:hypothetical protein